MAETSKDQIVARAEAMSEPGSTTWFERSSGDLSLMSAYAVVVSALYLWGYWTPFKIDILEYLSLVDIVKAAALPLALTMGAFTLGALISHVTKRKHLPPGGGRNDPTVAWLRKYSALAGAVWAAAVIALLFSSFSERWMVIASLVSPVLTFVAVPSGALRSLIPSAEARGLVVFVLCYALVLSFGLGQKKADYIRAGTSFQFVVPTSEAVLATTARNPQSYLRFLGHAGEVVFLWNPVNGSVTITKLDAKEPLVLLSCPEANRCSDPIVLPAVASPHKALACTPTASAPTASASKAVPATSAASK